jgi:hypothetical protein
MEAAESVSPRPHTWWKWTIRLGVIVAAVHSAYHNQLLAVPENGSLRAEQYVWLGGIAALAMVLLARVRQRPSRISRADLLVPALAVPLIVWWVLDRGMVHIAGYEHSLLANYGWLQLEGMRPHVDFPCTLCPHFYLGIKYAFLWFGVTFRSSVILTAIYAAVSFTWQYFLLRSMNLPKTSAAVIALLAQALCLMIPGYFWYNFVGSNDTVVLFLSALAWVDRPRSRLLIASVAVALGLVLLDKPNGWALPLCLAVGFAGSREHRFRFVACGLGAAGVVAAAAYFGPFDLAATLQTYSLLSETRRSLLFDNWRALNSDSWWVTAESGKLCAFVATFLTAAAVGLWTHRSKWRSTNGRWWARLWTFAGALAVGGALFITDNELKCTALAAPTVALAVWVAKGEPWRVRRSGASPRQVGVVFAAWLGLFSTCQALLLIKGARVAECFAWPAGLVVPTMAFVVWTTKYGWWRITRSQTNWIYLGFLTIGAVLVWTGYQLKWTDLVVATVAIAAGQLDVRLRRPARFYGNPRQVAMLFGVWLCLFCLAHGLSDGWLRVRVYCNCPGEFWEGEVSPEPLATAFMAGVHAGPRLVQVMDELDAVVRKHPNESIFFGPWIEFAYPAFGRRPPDGFPVWWHPGSSYFSNDAAFAIRTFRARRFDVLVLLNHHAFTDRVTFNMPGVIVRDLEKWYTVDEVRETLTVYRRKAKD